MSVVDGCLGEAIATFLWECEAVKVSPDEPFTLTSGAQSPLYVDCRRLISHVVARRTVTTYATLRCRRDMGAVDVVAGGETAGIPYAAFLAEALSLPMVYVRKDARAHGTGSQVEGMLTPGARALLCEDMVTDGQSKINFVAGLRQAGAEVRDCLVVLDRQAGAAETLARHGVALHALTDIHTTLQVGVRLGKLSQAGLRVVTDYLQHGNRP
jgi:orotate phosphoribosyltransferase